MFDRIRDLARRPVRDLPAGLVLALCALVLATGAMLIASTSDDPPPPPEHADAEPEVQEITLYDAPDDRENDDVPVDPARVRFPEAPSEDTGGLGNDYPPLKASDAAVIRQCARRFLRGYLPYSYGRGDVTEITDATLELLLELDREPPRPPADVAARHPRVVLVHLTDGGLTEPAQVIARIDDGRSEYTLQLQMKRTGFGAWSASSVGQ